MNSFAALGDSDDEEVVQKPKVKTEKVEKPEAKDAKKKEEKPKVAASAPAEDKAKKPVAAKTENKGDAKPKSKETSKDAAKEASKEDPKALPDGNDKEKNEKKHHFDREHAGRGAGRGGRGGRAVREGKREFDRHSGTGRGREVSRGGRGPGGWGNADEEALNAEKGREPVEGEEAVDGAGAGEDAAAPATEDEQTPKIEVPPEPTVFTLDEYLATKASARANTELFGTVSERRVEADFSGMRAKHDVLENFVDLGLSKTKKEAKKDQRSNEKKQILDLGFKNALLEPQPREDRRDDDRRDGGRGGGRGGRGGGRGGRGGGDRPPASSTGGRGYAPRASGAAGAQIDVLDSSAFPSL